MGISKHSNITKSGIAIIKKFIFLIQFT